MKINGDENSVLTGMIEAQEVEINGSHFTMVGRGPVTGGARPSGSSTDSGCRPRTRGLRHETELRQQRA